MPKIVLCRTPHKVRKRKAIGEHPCRGQAAFFFLDNDKGAREFPKNRKKTNFSLPFEVSLFAKARCVRIGRKGKFLIKSQGDHENNATMGAKHPISREWARSTQRGIGKERIGSEALAHTVTREHLILIFCPFAARRHLPHRVLRRRERGQMYT